MAALNFPTSPSINDTYTANGKTWTWDGTEWASTNFISLTSDVSGILPVANGGTGTSTAFTLGSVVFAGASGVYTQDNAKFFWDNTNDFLGIGLAAPVTELHVHRDSASGVVSLLTNSTTGATAGDGFERSIDASGGAYLWNYENQPIQIATNNTLRLTIAADGVATFTGPVIADTYSVSTDSINAQTGTTYTIVDGDNGKLVTCSNASAITVSLNTGLVAGFWCEVEQLGAGQVTIAGTGTKHSSNGLKTRAQYSVLRIRYEGTTNTYNVSGDTAV